MKRLKAMTNREWMQKHKPELIEECVNGGVCGCPMANSLENSMIKKCKGFSSCTACWNLPAKINGKYIMKVIEK